MSTVEERAERLVRNEVHVCLSSLVATLASVEGGMITGRSGRPAARGPSQLSGLIEQAFELSLPIFDFEEAARQAGWKTADSTPGMLVNDEFADDDGQAADAESWQEACAVSGVDPYEREIFEHWAVSKYLAEDLAELGERVDMDFAGMCVWGRTTTGQGIAQDSTIRRVLELQDKRVAALAT